MTAASQLALPFAAGGPSDVRQLVADVIGWAGTVPKVGIAPAERELLDRATARRPSQDRDWNAADCIGAEDWSEQLCGLRSVEERRDLGQFFTPSPIVDVMVEWCRQRSPEQVVDPGCGTGRFALAAARALPSTRVIAIDSDPVATLICRAQIARLGLSNIEVRCSDFLTDQLSLEPCRTAFVGNPPYVRHHRLTPEVKRWGMEAARQLGVPFSGLAGLHVYFFLATALRARSGDFGCYITSAEWLDVGYGKGLRQLLMNRLGVSSLSLLEESSSAFADAMTSALITCFEVGSRTRRIRVSVVDEFQRADGPEDSPSLSRDELDDRWGAALRGGGATSPADGLVRLREIARVHRGIATGANDFFVMEPNQAKTLGLQDFAKPVVSAAKQIIHSGGCVEGRGCKVLILLPKSLDGLTPPQRRAVDTYLAQGTTEGIPQRYLCRHRSPWWYLGEPSPPQIVASYMARRPPAFALNPNGLHILNIAHGIFPHAPVTGRELARLVTMLNDRATTFVGNGRRYQGGLEKFEPREMENLLIPPLAGTNA
jgi:SAM-dependent methyltransferase